MFEFIIPVARTAKQVKKQVNEMNSRMQEQMRQGQNQQHNNDAFQGHTTQKKAPNSDYIDFEEVK